MKLKNTQLLRLFIIVFALVMLNSCNKENGSKTSVEGKWTVYKIERDLSDGSGIKTTEHDYWVKYNSDGSIEQENASVNDYVTWSQNNELLTIYNSTSTIHWIKEGKEWTRSLHNNDNTVIYLKK